MNGPKVTLQDGLDKPMENKETEHIVKSYDRELNMLHDAILEMGDLVRKQIKDATQAILTHDIPKGSSIEDTDDTVDLLEQTIVNLSIKMIALRQPMGIDLRKIIAAQRISADLERMGDYAASAARRVAAMPEVFPTTLKADFETLSKLVVAFLRLTLENFETCDLKETRTLWHKDDEIDALYAKLMKSTIEHMVQNPEDITLCTHILFICKNFERMGDHITNVLESIHFLLTGALPREPRETTAAMRRE